MIMRNFKRAALAAFVIACVWFAGDSDFEEAQRAEAQYRADFCAGFIPDYKQKGIKCEGIN